MLVELDTPRHAANHWYGLRWWTTTILLQAVTLFDGCKRRKLLALHGLRAHVLLFLLIIEPLARRIVDGTHE